jgi:hypothetical protein
MPRYLLASQKNVVGLFTWPSFERFEDFVFPYASVRVGGSVCEEKRKMSDKLFLGVSLHNLLRC